MLVLTFQILYLLFFITMLAMSVFIIYHIVSFSYSTFSKLLTLAIFVPVVVVLLFTNLVLFRQIDLAKLFANLLM